MFYSNWSVKLGGQSPIYNPTTPTRLDDIPEGLEAIIRAHSNVSPGTDERYNLPAKLCDPKVAEVIVEAWSASSMQALLATLNGVVFVETLKDVGEVVTSLELRHPLGESEGKSMGLVDLLLCHLRTSNSARPFAGFVAEWLDARSESLGIFKDVTDDPVGDGYSVREAIQDPSSKSALAIRVPRSTPTLCASS